MKYVFKPLERNSYISHLLFMTPEERKRLQTRGEHVEVVGTFTVGGDDPAAERGKYRVVFGSDPEPVTKTSDGWMIYLPKTSLLDDVKNGGAAFLYSVAVIGSTIHQIVISDISNLEQSRFCDAHRDQTSSS